MFLIDPDNWQPGDIVLLFWEGECRRGGVVASSYLSVRIEEATDLNYFAHTDFRWKYLQGAYNLSTKRGWINEGVWRR